jgi:hypothetical protein
MKEKTNIKKSSSKDKFNIKPAKLKRANSLKPNKIIHIDKFRLPMDDINTEMRDIQKVLKTENSRQIKNKVLIKKTNMKIAKENIIVSLRKELKFQKLLNRNLLALKDYADKNSDAYKKNYDNICKYRAQMHEDLSGFVSLIGNYEKDINNFKKEKEMMIKTNESLINYKNEEQNKMKEKLEKLNNDTQIQNDKIEKLRKILREYRNENEFYFNNTEKNELNHLQRFEKLKSEYKRIENLYQYYYDLELKNIKLKMDKINKNLFAEEEDFALLKLKEKQVMGDFLRNIIRDIQTQMSEIDRLNKRMKDDRNIEKLLGKKGAEKYRQRLNEKYKSEISTLNTKYNMTFTSC